MTLALEMFAIAPAHGTTNLSGAQIGLLVGKASWIYAAAEAKFPVVPTICLTRAAWDGLQAERRLADDRLRKHWVATLFRLVGRYGTPPSLVVRTSAPRHSSGLMPARVDIPAPRNEVESVDVEKTDLKDKKLQRCVKTALVGVKLGGRPDEDLDVEYTLAFRVDND